MKELRTFVGRAVVLATSETALEGVVESATRSCVALMEARAVDGPTPRPIDGLVLVPSARIAYVQIVPA